MPGQSSGSRNRHALFEPDGGFSDGPDQAQRLDCTSIQINLAATSKVLDMHDDHADLEPVLRYLRMKRSWRRNQ